MTADIEQMFYCFRVEEKHHDGIISLPSESEAISLSYEAFVPCDRNENLKKIDSDESFPRSFGLCWILKDNTLQFFVPMTEKPFTRQENDSAVLVYNLKLDENRGSLLDLFRKEINIKRVNNILDDFLQEDLITVDEHEEISVLSETCKTKAAELLIAAVERSCSLKLLSILKSYGAGNIVNHLQRQVEKMTIDVRTESEASVSAKIRDGKDYLFSCDLAPGTKVEIKITSKHENRLNLHRLIEVIRTMAGEILAQKTHCSVERTSEGSIIILLQTETSDAVEKLRQFIENGDMSKFLKQLFETTDVRKLMKKDKYTVEIEIKKVKSSATDFSANVPPGKETPTSKYNCILERCHCFLMEELEPGYFLRNEEVAPIFAPIRYNVTEQTNRTQKNELLLEYLKKQPEETIQLVLENLEKRNRYIYRQLFPKTEKFQDIDQVASY
ncbi:uncharacterized protein LOC144617998 [Crassostrea virginica]